MPHERTVQNAPRRINSEIHAKKRRPKPNFQRSLRLPSLAMARRVSRAAASLPLIRYSKLSEASPLIGVVRRALSSSSSSSSSSPSTSSKPDKKIRDRLSAVIDAANDRKLPPELRGQRNGVRSETDITNIVEQRIWHSMEEGQFENLPGKGKPLDLSTNPHVDPAEDTLYRILSRNKCAPEWVELNKEIRDNIAQWRLGLQKALAHREAGNNSKWLECSEALKVQLRSINNKVFRYNLIVPYGRQMFGLKWEKELDRNNEKKN